MLEETFRDLQLDLHHLGMMRGEDVPEPEISGDLTKFLDRTLTSLTVPPAGPGPGSPPCPGPAW